MKHLWNDLVNITLFKIWRWRMLRDLRKSRSWDQF